MAASMSAQSAITFEEPFLSWPTNIEFTDASRQGGEVPQLIDFHASWRCPTGRRHAPECRVSNYSEDKGAVDLAIVKHPDMQLEH